MQLEVESMDVIMIGAGPTGLTCGAALARRGHRVLAVDPDPGPAPDGSWRRRGVMQFDLAHGYRPQVRDLLVEEWPEAWAQWLALGAVPIELPGAGDTTAVGVRSRRPTHERALRNTAADVFGLTLRVGRVERVIERRGRTAGVVVDGAEIDADLVIDASGRLSRLAAPAVLDGETGMSYVNRTYRRLPASDPGPMTSPVAWTGIFDGYQVYVFPHEHGHFSVVLIRPTATAALTELRHRDVFEAACAAIPGAAAWIDPRSATPTGGVVVGGGLRNTYRPQQARPGLVAVGDAVTTTAPTAGRGVAMASMQIGALLRLLDEGADPLTVAEPFGAWCDEWMRPWVEDHLEMDSEAVRLWQGHDLDLDRPLTAAAVVAAAQCDLSIHTHIGGYLGMTALPSSLAPAEPAARRVYESGWRPPWSEGPSVAELQELIDLTLSSRRAAG